MAQAGGAAGRAGRGGAQGGNGSGGADAGSGMSAGEAGDGALNEAGAPARGTGGSGTTGHGGSSAGRAPSAGAPGMPPPADGLVLWLDAASDPTRDEQGGVSVWLDRSGAGNDATQTLAKARPRFVEDGFAAGPAVAFDGGNDTLELPPGFEDFSEGLSFFSIFELESDSNCPLLLGLEEDAGNDDIAFIRQFGFLQYQLGGDYARSTSSLPLVVPHLFSLIHDTSQVATLYENQLDVGSHAGMPLPRSVTRTLNRIAQGHDRDGDNVACFPFEGLIGEILLYRRALTESERVGVEAYLAEKWQCCGS